MVAVFDAERQKEGALKAPLSRSAESRIPPSPMGPHREPQSTFTARRAATTERLLRAGIPLSWVVLDVASYEADAAHMPHLARAPDFWDRAYDYIARQHAAPGRPESIDATIDAAARGGSTLSSPAIAQIARSSSR